MGDIFDTIQQNRYMKRRTSRSNNESVVDKLVKEDTSDNQSRTQNHLYTYGGEYQLLPFQGSYVGPYHIHPEKGAMVGSVHTEKKHASLTPIKSKRTEGSTHDYDKLDNEQTKHTTMSTTQKFNQPSSDGNGGGSY
tara:strand:+ start:346 stop:753 length:408 start_codon:yes stop_codon:yes gene_type:complete